ncbi:MAG: hypothetical protein Q4A17_05600 [Thermoguttaceae bacterium]|nr:hypothetical protein [Thermoguttaceae bacterium]
MLLSLVFWDFNEGVLGIVGLPVVLAILAYPYGKTVMSVCTFAAGGWLL